MVGKNKNWQTSKEKNVETTKRTEISFKRCKEETEHEKEKRNM